MAINKDNVLDASWNNESLLQIRTALQELLNALGDSIDAAAGGNPASINLSVEGTVLTATVTLADGETELSKSVNLATMGFLTQHQSLKTVNGKSITGSGDVDVVHPVVIYNTAPMQFDDTLPIGTVYFDGALHRMTATTPESLGAPRKDVIYFSQQDSAFFRWNDAWVKVMEMPDISALTTAINSKANASDVVKSISVNGTAQTKDGNGNVAISGLATTEQLTQGLGQKQDVLTFDNAPTAGSNNPVKSGGIKTAIDNVMPTIDANGKWVIGGVSTNHDAHGPMGNITIEDAEDMVALIVNDLTTGGQTSFLSAEMGKALLSVLLQIFGNLGEYAFPNGKPTLNFNTQISFPISYSQSDLHVTYADGQGGTAPTTVELLGRLEIQLGTNDDLYVIKESAVKVFVGGTEVANAYDPTTDKIVIPEVYGNVVIVAEAMTYVQDDLVLHLDCLHRGGTGSPVTGHWKSLVNYNGSPIDFSLINVQESNTGIGFTGSSYGETDTSLDLLSTECTVDFTGTISSGNNIILFNKYNKGVGMIVSDVQNQGRIALTRCSLNGEDMVIDGSVSVNYKLGDSQNNLSMSLNVHKGWSSPTTELPRNSNANFSTQFAGFLSKVTLGKRQRSATETDFFVGTIKSLRVYGRNLTPEEQKRNLTVDKKRFNL